MKRTSEDIREAIADCETIAKSAMLMAVERTQDLGQNPVITLVMIETLAKHGIEEYAENNESKIAGMPMQAGIALLRKFLKEMIDKKYEEFRAEQAQ